MNFPLQIIQMLKFNRTQEIPAWAAVPAASACAAVPAAAPTFPTHFCKQNPVDPPLLVCAVIS
jgi:hypothetical protein